MARRNGRKGDWLATDYYTGFTVYASKLQKDFWGAYAVKPLLRNLQEIASPLDDPQPVQIYSGPDYESITTCSANNAPLFVGNTTVLTNTNNAAAQAFALLPGIGGMEVGCNFIVYPG